MSANNTPKLDLKITRIKLFNVQKDLTARMAAPLVRYFDSTICMPYFDSYNNLLTHLKANYEDYFSEMSPVYPRKIPQYIIDGIGKIEYSDIKTLVLNVGSCINLIDEISKGDVPNIDVTREGIFFIGQHYDAYRFIRDIIRQAASTIYIIDNYIGDSLLDTLTNKNADVVIRILTQEVKSSLSVAIDKFNKQYGNIEVKITKSFHDRFLIVDKKEFYHFGASLKDLGKKGFMFSKIEEPNITKSLLTEFDSEWEKAPLP